MVVPVYIYLDLLSLSTSKPTAGKTHVKPRVHGFTDEFTVDGTRPASVHKLGGG
jgi:hypothetical protein